MPRRELDEEETKRLRERRRRIGSILREMRRSAALPRTFAKSLGISDAMVGMIEAGRSPLPSEKTYEYVAALNVNGNYVSPDQLVLAYASIRRARGDERFPWDSWNALPDDVVAQYLRGELTKRPPNPDTAELGEHEFDALTPIQLQMVKEIAGTIGRFGSRIVTEDALAAWERANSTKIINLRAAVTCLESELTDKYIKSMRHIAEQGEFGQFQYIISTAGNSLPSEWKTLRKELNLPSEKLPDPVLIDPAAFYRLGYEVTNLARGLGVSDSTYRPPERKSKISDWDAFYYYQMMHNARGGLMFGVFRRLSHSKSRVRDIALGQWGAEPINETLPWPCIQRFEQLHNALWIKHNPPTAGVR